MHPRQCSFDGMIRHSVLQTLTGSQEALASCSADRMDSPMMLFKMLQRDDWISIKQQKTYCES